MTDDAVRLRPHHLLCVLTYGGAGYTPEFTANMTAIVNRLGDGAEVVLVAGPDSICDPMLCCQDHPSFHCHNDSVRLRDEAAIRDIAAALAAAGDSAPARAADVRVGGRLRFTPDLIRFLRALFATGTIRSACTECEWHPRCTERAAGGFQGSVLKEG